jgi:hypothetical protein
VIIVRTHIPSQRGRSGFGIILFSILLLVSFFWQSRVQAGNFATPVYNAGLARLIVREKVHALWVDCQSHNILFNRVFQWLSPRFDGLMRPLDFHSIIFLTT